MVNGDAFIKIAYANVLSTMYLFFDVIVAGWNLQFAFLFVYTAHVYCDC